MDPRPTTSRMAGTMLITVTILVVITVTFAGAIFSVAVVNTRSENDAELDVRARYIANAAINAAFAEISNLDDPEGDGLGAMGIGDPEVYLDSQGNPVGEWMTIVQTDGDHNVLLAVAAIPSFDDPRIVESAQAVVNAEVEFQLKPKPAAFALAGPLSNPQFPSMTSASAHIDGGDKAAFALTDEIGWENMMDELGTLLHKGKIDEKDLLGSENAVYDHPWGEVELPIVLREESFLTAEELDEYRTRLRENVLTRADQHADLVFTSRIQGDQVWGTEDDPKVVVIDAKAIGKDDVFDTWNQTIQGHGTMIIKHTVRPQNNLNMFWNGDVFVVGFDGDGSDLLYLHGANVTINGNLILLSSDKTEASLEMKNSVANNAYDDYQDGGKSSKDRADQSSKSSKSKHNTQNNKDGDKHNSKSNKDKGKHNTQDNSGKPKKCSYDDAFGAQLTRCSFGSKSSKSSKSKDNCDDGKSSKSSSKSSKSDKSSKSSSKSSKSDKSSKSSSKSSKSDKSSKSSSKNSKSDKSSKTSSKSSKSDKSSSNNPKHNTQTNKNKEKHNTQNNKNGDKHNDSKSNCKDKSGCDKKETPKPEPKPEPVAKNGNDKPRETVLTVNGGLLVLAQAKSHEAEVEVEGDSRLTVNGMLGMYGSRIELEASGSAKSELNVNGTLAVGMAQDFEDVYRSDDFEFEMRGNTSLIYDKELVQKAIDGLGGLEVDLSEEPGPNDIPNYNKFGLSGASTAGSTGPAALELILQAIATGQDLGVLMENFQNGN